MRTCRNYLLPALALAALTPSVWAEKTTTVTRRIDLDPLRPVMIDQDDVDVGGKEKVTFLGVETAPMNRTLGAQLGLPKDTGLIVTHVMEKSPAAGALKDDDVLIRIDDQILVDTHQLSVLVRTKKEGDEVGLTFFRGGKEMSARARLGTREVSRHANVFFHRHGGADLLPLPGGAPELAGGQNLPGMDPDDARDVLRMIEHERGNFLVGPGALRIIGRAGRGATIVDLPKSNISYSDDEGSIEIKVDDGKRSLTVKNPKGDLAFSGPINTPEERGKLPPEIGRRLEKLETDTISFEAGEDFQPETIPLPSEPAKTKISHPVDGAKEQPTGLRTL